MTSSLTGLETIGYDRIAADPGGTQEAFARIGYSLAEALADLVDNSIDADASAVHIRLLRDEERIRQIAVADNGWGMSTQTLKLAMQFGARLPHRVTDRGKYGIGLKSASFSQAQSVSVATRRDEEASGRRWTVGDIRRGWYCARLSTPSTERLLEHGWIGRDANGPGTVVLWEDLDRLGTLDDGIDATVQKTISSLAFALGLVFHRFIESGRLRIILDSENTATGAVGLPISVAAMDPFGYPRTGRRGYPKRVEVSVRRLGAVAVEMHIWPPKMRTSEYRLGGGKVSARQGFYFYRNDRLIQAGGWNGIREDDAEPHLSLARVKVDLPVAMDAMFQLTVQKAGVEVPSSFRESLRRGATNRRMATYFRDADATYRAGTAPIPDEPELVLGPGVPAPIRSVSRRLWGRRRETRALSIKWGDLPEGTVFEMDRDRPALVLNALYRDRLAGGRRSSVNDLAAVKALLYFALREEFGRQRRSRASDEYLARLHELMLSVVADV